MRLVARSTFVRQTAKFISAAAILAAATESQAQLDGQQTSTEATGRRFRDFLAVVQSAKDSSARRTIIDEYLARVRSHSRAIIEDSTVYFVYQGKARSVAIAGDLNGWDPSADTMTRIPRTNLFVLSKNVPPAARFEYKFVVDSAWILDPLNAQKVMGGYGANSEIWMPRYQPPPDIEYRPDILHGKLETLSITSSLLQRTHPVFVYLPPSYKKSGRKKFPTLYVTDGGEYITLARMTNVLDNLIAEKRIEPIIGVFVDPRTDIRDLSTSKRMFDYTMSDTFVSFITDELRGSLTKKYRLTSAPENTGIMGASLGGLIATYTAFKRPDVFGLCAAQSPSYWWKNDSMITIARQSPRKNIRFYISTGTIRDAQEKASAMKIVLERKEYAVKYEEHPEGHNWANWRARLANLLEYFWSGK
ncbi:MAG: prolyl oligopeptidase family serine peptidase [Ignavibacteriae bacterium]|nr:prolyl oligopeptidase family serine peptidase [Ignavibacteriota bacterium]